MSTLSIGAHVEQTDPVAEALVEHAFVRGVLIDDEEAFRPGGDDEGLAVLPDRHDVRRPLLRRRRRRGVGARRGRDAHGGPGRSARDLLAVTRRRALRHGVSGVDRRHGLQAPLLLAREQRRVERVVDEPERRAGVGEADLRLRRRDVDVDGPRLGRQKEEGGGMPVDADRVPGRLPDRAGECPVLDRPAVHEQVLVTAARKRHR